MLGAAGGGALGMGTGIAVEQSLGSALIGLGVGVVTGSVLGYAAHKDPKPGEMATMAVAKDFDGKVPSLSSPEVRRIWVPEKIEGNKYIEGHYLYLIDRPAFWGK